MRSWSQAHRSLPNPESMTPLQVAKQECANCDGADNCTGIGIADNLTCHIFRTPGKCWLAPDESGKIQPCTYFEECVAPLAKARSREAATHEQKCAAAKLTEGVHAYETAVMPVPSAKYAKCLRCQHKAYPPKRLCPKCGRLSVLKSKRLHINAKRSRCRKNTASESLSINDL